jgi:hypothetical protein
MSTARKAVTLKGDRIAEEFQAIVEDYVEKRFGANDRGSRRRSPASWRLQVQRSQCEA